MACRVLVITTKDVENGFFIPTNGHITLAERIVLLLRDQEFASKMDEKGRELIHSKYEWSKKIYETVNYCCNLLKPWLRTDEFGLPGKTKDATES